MPGAGGGTGLGGVGFSAAVDGPKESVGMVDALLASETTPPAAGGGGAALKGGGAFLPGAGGGTGLGGIGFSAAVGTKESVETSPVAALIVSEATPPGGGGGAFLAGADGGTGLVGGTGLAGGVGLLDGAKVVSAAASF